MAFRFSISQRLRLAAFFVILIQVASKAVRDGFFLSTVGAKSLPTAMLISAPVSLMVLFLSSQLLARVRISQGVNLLYGLSFLLCVTELVFLHVSRPAAAWAIYIHISALGSVLISSFWALAGSHFNPSTAKVHLAPIGVGATLGGLVGGILSERCVKYLGSEVLFAVVAAIHLVIILLSVGHAKIGPHQTRIRITQAVGKLVRPGFLRNLFWLGLLAAIAAGLLDFLLKSKVEERFHDAESIARFFAIFYASIGGLSFVLQVGFAKRLLSLSNPARTLAALPLWTLAFGGLFLFFPWISIVSLARGGDAAFQNSLVKTAREQLYAALPDDLRRTIKVVVDVGSDRLGDALAGIVIQVLLFWGVATDQALVSIVLVIAGLGLLAVFWNHLLYPRALGTRLLSERPRGSTEKVGEDWYYETFGHDGAVYAEDLLRSTRQMASSFGAESQTHTSDLEQFVAKDASIEVATHTIHLLGDRYYRQSAEKRLINWGEVVVGIMSDRMLDTETPTIVRRHVATTLGKIGGERAVFSLKIAALDPEPSLRLRAVESLVAIRKSQNIEFDQDDFLQCLKLALRSDVSAERDDAQVSLSIPTAALSFRAHFVLTTFALRQPIAMVEAAYTALCFGTDDERGTALEYILSNAPSSLREEIEILLRSERGQRDSFPSEDSIQDTIDRLLDTMVLGDDGNS